MKIKQLFSFLLGKTFWLNIIAMIIVAIVLFFGVFKWLDIYTEHGKAEIVPDLKNMKVQESVTILQKTGLRYEVIDSVYNKKATPGTVVEQLPAAGSRVKRNRIIYLTVNATSPLTIVVPDVRETSQRQAMAILEGSGFQIGKIKRTPSEYRNLVIDISYAGASIVPGQKLPEGSVIDMLVGQGYSSEVILIPSFAGLTLGEASNSLFDEGLVLGGIHYDVAPADEADKQKYIIYRQIPSAQTTAPKGKAIDLYLTKDLSRLQERDPVKEETIEIDNEDESWF